MHQSNLFDHLADHPIQPFGLKLAWEAVITVDPRQDLGPGPMGHHYLVPISGGQFRGGCDYPDFKGAILPGGADRQILREDGIRQLRAIYEMQIADGTVISIENQVVVDPDIQPTRYAASHIAIRAPVGPWDWLNRRLFLGSLQSSNPGNGHVVVRGWEVTL